MEGIANPFYTNQQISDFEGGEPDMIRTQTAWAARALATGLVMLGLSSQSFAECYEKGPLPTIRRSYTYRDINDIGVYEVNRRPSQYGWARRRVAQSGHVVWHEEPAQYRTVSTHVRVHHGWSWETRLIHGKEILCRVRRPDTYETVEKRVLISRGRRWAEREPATVGYVEDRILLRPYKNIVHYYPPTVRYRRETLSIQPEGYRLRPTRLGSDC